VSYDCELGWGNGPRSESVNRFYTTINPMGTSGVLFNFNRDWVGFGRWPTANICDSAFKPPLGAKDG
jgi:hypothetical protein